MMTARCALLSLVAAAGLMGLGTAHAQQTLTIASFGGAVDDNFRRAMDGFEKKFEVKLQWVPANATANAAKVVATKARPEIDVVLLEDLTYPTLLKSGVYAKLDPAIVTNYADIIPQAKLAEMQGVAIGMYLTGLFYNEAEFKKNNWAKPKSWNDLFRPEFCNRVGIPDPAVSYTTNLLMVLAKGDGSKVPQSIDTLAKLKGCLATLEPTSAKLEEKIQLGEYVIGLHGSVRIVPLAASGLPVRFVAPEEGTSLAYTTASVVAGGKEKLAQEFINWIISPAAQESLTERFVPVNSKVKIPQKMLDAGMPTSADINKAMTIDGAVVAERRRDWTREVQKRLFP